MNLFTLLLFPVLLAAPQVSPTYRISGTVYSAHDGSAIAHAHLRLTPANDQLSDTSDNAKLPETFSDDLGHFTMVGPGAGRWVITASARGFHQQGYLQHEQFQSALVLTPAAPSLDLDLRLEPDAAIAGSVLDEAGEPVRDAQVTLSSAPPADSELNLSPRGPLQVRTTDDLGHYELSGLEPGAYRISVSARPWYASAARPQRDAPASTAASALDVVYPLTWYPGATDPEAADILTLQPGDTRQADFRLLAVPATHLRVNTSSPPRPDTGDGRRPRPGLPQLDRVSGTAPSFVPPSIVFNEAGQAELGGLTPGLYRVRFPGNLDSSEPLFLRVTASSPREVDLSAALPAVHVGFTFQGLQHGQTTQVALTDVSTGARFDFLPPPPDEPAQLPEGQRSGRRRFGGRFGDGRTLYVPSGRYRVTVPGAESVYLTSIDATGATVRGNLVDLRETAANLTLHVGTDPATVRGICLLHGQPVTGAMVVLVPASLGQPGSIPLILRDQSDSDGSFLLPRVVPGPYILLAIQNGWSLNWRDPATLQRYLLNGVPLAPVRRATVRQTIEVQLP